MAIPAREESRYDRRSLRQALQVMLAKEHGLTTRNLALHELTTLAIRHGISAAPELLEEAE
jgi:hypothetical protein